MDHAGVVRFAGYGNSSIVNVENVNPTEIKPLSRARGSRPFGLYDLNLPDLRQKLIELGQPGYRAKQIYDWTYSRLASSYEAMTNLPVNLRATLHETLPLALLTPVREIATDNGDTIKTLYQTTDGQFVETVLMLYRDRATVCISCQVGCAVGCAFCATGIGGLTRNLTAGEMVMQAVDAARRARGLGRHIDQSGHDGHGRTPSELCADHANDRDSARPRRLQLRRAPDHDLNLRHRSAHSGAGERAVAGQLEVSLHAPNDELRGQLVPINKRWPVAELMAAVETYTQTTHRRVSFEYALMGGINDSDEIAEELGRLLRKRLCHLNLIPYNPVDLLEFERPSPERIARFAEIVEAAGVPVTVRYSRGVEIAAACGQLRANQERASIPSTPAS